MVALVSTIVFSYFGSFSVKPSWKTQTSEHNQAIVFEFFSFQVGRLVFLRLENESFGEKILQMKVERRWNVVIWFSFVELARIRDHLTS